MVFKKPEISDYRAILLLVLTILPLVASTNINCHGKPFHCMNSTHFMICVDIGGGYSSTIDNFVIPCPPTTVCRQNNRFECEFPPAIPSTSTLEILQASTRSVGSTTTGKPNAVTTDIPAQTTDTLIYDNFNSVSLATVNTTQFFVQQTSVTPTSSIQAMENVTVETDSTVKNIDTSILKSTEYPNIVNVQLTSPTPKDNKTNVNYTAADAVNKITTVETYTSGRNSYSTHIPINGIEHEKPTEPAAFVISIQKINSNGIDNNTKDMSPTSVRPTSLVTEQILTGPQSSTTSVGNVGLVSTPTKLTTLPVSSDSAVLPVTAVTENYLTLVESVIIATSNNNTLASNRASSTLDTTVEKLQNNDTDKITQVPTTHSKLIAGTEESLSSLQITNKDGYLIGITTEKIASKPVDGQNISNNILQETTTTSSSTNVFNRPLTANTVTVVIADTSNRSTDFQINKTGKGVDNTVKEISKVDILNIAKPTSPLTEPTLVGLQSSSLSVLNIGLVSSPIRTDFPMFSMNTVGEKYTYFVNSETNESLTNFTNTSDSYSSTLDSTGEKLHNNNTAKITQALTKQSELNTGTEGSLYSYHITDNIIDGNLMDITTEKIISQPVDVENISNYILNETATTSSNTNYFNGPLTTNMVTVAMADTANKSTDIQINKDWKSVDNTVQRSSAVDILETVKPTSPVTEVALAGLQSSISSTLNIGSGASQSELTTSPVSTDSPMFSINTVGEKHTTSVNNESSINITIASYTSSLTSDSTANISHNNDTVKTTQAPTKQIFFTRNDGNVSSNHLTDGVIGENLLINITTQKIPLKPIDGENIFFHIFEKTTTTNSNTNNFDGPITTNMVTVAIVDAENRSTVSQIMKDRKGVDSTVQRSYTYNFSNTVKPTSPVTEPTSTGQQSSSSSVLDMESVSIQRKPTASFDTTDSSMSLKSTMAETDPALINFDINASSNYNTVTYKVPPVSSDVSPTILTNDNISNTTQAGEITIRTKQPDIATERGLMTHHSTDSIEIHTNNTTFGNTALLSIDGSTFSSTLVDVATTSSYSNTFIGTNNTDLVNVLPIATSNGGPNTLGTQSWEPTVPTIHERPTFNITDKVKSTSPLTPLVTSYTKSSTSVVEDIGSISIQSTVFPFGTNSPISVNASTLLTDIGEYKIKNISEIKSSTIDASNGVFSNNKTLKATQEYTKKLDIGNETDYFASGHSNYNNKEYTSMTDIFSQNLNTLQDIAPTTTSYSDTFNGRITTHMTTVATKATVNKPTDMNVSQNWDEAVIGILEGSTIRISETLKPINPVTGPILGGNSQVSTSDLTTKVPVNSVPSITPLSTVAEKSSYSFFFDIDKNVTNYTAISELLAASNLTGNGLNSNTIEYTTQDHTKQTDIGIETTLSSYNTIGNILEGNTNNIDTKVITTIPVKVRNISNGLQNTVTTINSNSFDALLTTNMVAELNTDTSGSSTDILTNKNEKSIVKNVQESSTSNITNNEKASNLVTEQNPSNSSRISSLAVESMNQSQWTTSDIRTDSIILSVSTVTEYPISSHLKISADAIKNTNTSIPLRILDANGGNISNNITSNNAQAASNQPEPNGGSEKRLSTYTSTDMTMRGNTRLNQHVSNKLKDTATETPSFYSNISIDAHTTHIIPVAIIDIANRSIDPKETRNQEIVNTTLQENSRLNRSDFIQTTIPVTVARLNNLQSSTTGLHIENTTVSVAAVAENYPASGLFDMSGTNNDIISESFTTFSDVTIGNIKTNTVPKTTKAHAINNSVAIESSISSYNTTDIIGINTINMKPGNILTTNADTQNYSHISLPDIATTSFYSNYLNRSLTTEMVAEGIMDTEIKSTDTLVNQNRNGDLTIIQDSSTLNTLYTLQTASPMTVVILPGNSQSSPSAEEKISYNSTIPMSSITEKYYTLNNFDISINITNNTLKEKSSYSIDEKSNTTSENSQGKRKLADVGKESSITSYASTNSNNIVWLLINSTTQGFHDLSNNSTNHESTSKGLGTSITDSISFISRNHTENTMTNSGSNSNNGQTTPTILKDQDLTSTVYSIESNSSLYLIENSTPKQANNAPTTELDNKKNAGNKNDAMITKNSIHKFRNASTSRITEITTTTSVTNPLEDVLLHETSNNQQSDMTSTPENASSFKTRKPNNSNDLITPLTLSSDYINAKPEFFTPVTSTPQQHKMDSENNNVVETIVSSVHYNRTQNFTSISTPVTQTLTTETLSIEDRNQLNRASTQVINSSFHTRIPDSNELSYLNNTETISTKQTNIENSADYFPDMNLNRSNEILKQTDPVVNIFTTTKYPRHHSEDLRKTHNPKSSSNIYSYLTPVTENQLTILSSVQTTEAYSSVGNVVSTPASDHSKNQTHNNGFNTLSSKTYMNNNHDISNQNKNIFESKSNRTVNNRTQIENQAVTHGYTNNHIAHNIHKENYFTPSKSEYVNVDNGSTNTMESFNCRYYRRGRYADRDDCRKFYICIGNYQPISGTCPVNTVFSEINKQCTKNLSHCIRNNQFQCTSEGRFGDFLKDSIYYICVRNAANALVRFKLQCQNGYYLNKTDVRCTRNTEGISESTSVDSDSSKKNTDQSITKTKSQESEESIGNYESFRCEAEGKFADPNDCRRYYVCSKRNKSGLRRKKKKCDSEEVFHKGKKKCVVAESDEC